MTIDGTSDMEIIVKVRVDWQATLGDGSPEVEVCSVRLYRDRMHSSTFVELHDVLDGDTLQTIRDACEEEADIAQEEDERDAR